MAALKKVKNASEEDTTQQEEFPDPLENPKEYREAVLADARQIVEDGLKKGLQAIQPLRAESAEKQIVKAVTPHLPKETTAMEAITSFKNDVLVKMSPEERDRRIDYYDNFPEVFIQDISNHAKVQTALKVANSEEKADTFINTRKALKKAAEHTDDNAEFNNTRVVEEESPEDELLSTIAQNLDDEEEDDFDAVE